MIYKYAKVTTKNSHITQEFSYKFVKTILQEKTFSYYFF